MINIFTKTADQVGSALRDFNETNLPHEGILPDTATGEHSVLGKDANLPLIVKELGALQLESIKSEKQKLQTRLVDLEKYEHTLNRLLEVVNNVTN